MNLSDTINRIAAALAPKTFETLPLAHISEVLAVLIADGRNLTVKTFSIILGQLNEEGTIKLGKADFPDMAKKQFNIPIRGRMFERAFIRVS